MQEQEEVTIHLDSLDQKSDSGVHLNQNGWFDFTGKSHADHSKMLLKPTKRVLKAACCGHQWRFGKSITPRTLSLREMLLVSMVNWKDVRKINKHHH